MAKEYALTEAQIRHLACAMTNYKYAGMKLKQDDIDGYRTWLRMTNDQLALAGLPNIDTMFDMVRQENVRRGIGRG